MSVSKSVVGCVAAALIDRGQLDPDPEITGYVPELAASGFPGALVRHVYDMRSGVRFLEEYANPDSDIRRLDEWVGWQESAEPGQGEPRGVYRFLVTLRAEAPHGQRFLYRSAESDVLGWVCERAAGRPMADADLRADLGADGRRTRRPHAARRPGRRRARRGPVRHRPRRGQVRPDAAGQRASSRRPGGTRRVVPPQWLRRAWAVDADARSVFAASPAEWAFPGGWYRHQFWFRPGAYGDVLLCLGIHGQMLHVPAHEHGLREVLHLAGRAEPGLPGGHAARLRRGRRFLAGRDPGDPAAAAWPGWSPA